LLTWHEEYYKNFQESGSSLGCQFEAKQILFLGKLLKLTHAKGYKNNEEPSLWHEKWRI
jgi:hypothetical protein